LFLSLAKRLAQYDAEIKEREAAVSSIELSQYTKDKQEARKVELQELQSSVSADLEDNTRQRKALALDKEKWEKQKGVDQKGVDNERQEIRNQNAALAKEKAEYKDKLLKKMKAGVV